MNCLVCISKTPETTAKIAFTSDQKSFDSAGINHIMNPYDEWYALVRALEIKESLGGKVAVINVGPAANDIIIRKALAIGADEAVRIDAPPREAYFTATQIAHYAREKAFDIIFTGKETIDYNEANVGAMVAEMLDWPFVSFASQMDAGSDKAVLSRDVEGGVERLEVPYPMVVSAAKGLAEQRIPNMRGIMMAKRKPLQVLSPIESDQFIDVVRFELPEEKSGVRMVDPDSMDELVKLLHEEAKVI